LNADVVEAAQNLGFSSLLSIVQVLGKNDPGKKIEITVVTDNMQDVNGDDGLCPGKATVLGLVKSINNEYTGIQCRSIDVILSKKGSSPPKEQVRQLFDELTGQCVEPVVAYRNVHRWVQSFEPFHLERSKKKNPRLREEGVYLVTGGLGGIGLLLAGHLAKTVRAKLVLTGRSAFPPRKEWQRLGGEDKEDDVVKAKIGRLKALEEAGAEVLPLQADVTDETQVRQVIHKTLEKFGRINGVIHAAGLPDGELIRRKKPGPARNLLEAKVRGTLLLDKALKEIDLDFFVLCSSMASLRAGIGQASYGAANNFLDAFARYKFYQGGVFTVSINWDRWQKVGIAVIAESMHKKLTGEELAGGISPEQGVEIFNRIINETQPQVIVSTLDPRREIERPGVLDASSLIKNIEDKDLFTSARRRPELETEYIAPGSDREQKIAAVWAKFFGFGQVGVADDFFELGGDSLKAMVVAAKIHKELNIELPFQEFFNRPTIRELVEYLDRHGKKSVYVSIETVEKKEYYPLTSAQKRLYILQQMDMNSKSYNQTNFAQLEGEPDKSRFERAFRQLIRRHESLRTSFALINGAPVQVIHNGVEFEFRFHDQANGVELIPGAIIETFINPFDLSRAPLLRVGLVKMGPREYLLMVDMHHIIADGISLEILKRDFMSLYGQEELPILHLGYRDFSEWQNRRLDSGEIKKQEQYWLKEFVGEIPHLDLPGDYPRPDVQDAAGRKFKMQLSAEQTLGLKRLSKEQDVTLYMTTLAVLKVFLAILCGQESLVVGTSTAGRSHDDLQDIIGMFVNTLALKSDPAGDKRFDGFLREIKGISLAALENQEYPFEELVEKLSLSRDMSRNPLFDVMFSFQNFEAPPLEAPLSSLPAAEPAVPLKKEPYAFEELTSRFDLTLFVEETAATLLFIFEYRTTLFKPDTIERFGHYLEKTVSAILANPGVRLGTIEILAAEEKQRLLYEFNPTGVEYPVDMTVHELFARQVRQNPDRVALVGSDLQITKYNLQTNHKPIDEMQISYRELNERAVRVAGTLGEKGVRSDTLVGIMAERSPEMITGILGILKAGGAYLPIDPGYPGERIKFMLADSSAKLLLTTGNLAKESEKVRRWEGEKILLEKIFAVPKSNAYLLTLLPSYLQNSSTLAYIIYTSGTTGRPKGAAITHGNVVRLLFNDRFPFDFSEADVWTLFHSFCFDFSVWEMYGALLYGGKLVVVPAPALRDPAAYLGILRRSGVTVLNQTPSAFYHLMAEELKENFNRLRLRYVIFGGEALSPGKLEKWHEAYPGTCLVNMYGITETTVHVTYKEITAPGMRLGLSNIGKPIPTLEVYVMDQSERLSCPGAAGELWVGGAGVCRGYLNRPELTQEKFDHDLKDLWDYHDKKNRNSKKFLEVSEGAGSPSLLKFTRRVPSLTLTTNTNTLYKTGDLARWLEDSGELEYLGRIDGQVKIRGYRVELGEIQSRLLKHEQITGAVVQAGEEESGTRFLCAYYVSAHLLAVSALRDFLSRELPGYMLPSYFVRVDSIPLTVNGKVDWKSLPAPGEFQPHLKNAYAAPATEMENIIASVWQEVLQLKKIGIDDNFFEIGGHSLNILQVNARLAELSGKKYPLVAIFRYPTIRAFARFLQQQGAGEGIDIGRRAEAIKRAKEQRKQRNPKKTGNPGGQG
jgi:amino acid adenylation domain-containing protein